MFGYAAFPGYLRIKEAASVYLLSFPFFHLVTPFSQAHTFHTFEQKWLILPLLAPYLILWSVMVKGDTNL